MTRMTDLIHNTKAVVAVAPQSKASAGDVVGEVIDTQGFYAMLLQVSLGEGSGVKVKVKEIKESDDQGMSNATDVPTSQIIGKLGVDNSTVKTAKAYNIIPTKRYVKVTLTTTGETALVSANALLFGADVDGTINE